jgi:hypothetical protein
MTIFAAIYSFRIIVLGMSQKLIAFLMLLAVAGLSFSKAIALLDYQLNRNYIEKTLCENRNMPACCCHGKCFLKKQLQKDEDAGKNKFPWAKEKPEQVFFCETYPEYLIAPFLQQKPRPGYLLKKYESTPSPVFHPPAHRAFPFIYV